MVLKPAYGRGLGPHVISEFKVRILRKKVRILRLKSSEIKTLFSKKKELGMENFCHFKFPREIQLSFLYQGGNVW